MQFLIRNYLKLLYLLALAGPIMMLIVRLWIARVFWASGLVSISDWGNTIYLFTHEFSVPVLSPWLAAVSSTTFELACPVLLTIGLAARLATLPLLAMTAVINFTYDNNIEHAYWAMLLGMILFYGPGKLSVDYWINKRYAKA